MRHRPKGLEFPACGKCNAGGRLDELIAAMLSRVYPDAETEAEREEVSRLMAAVANNVPGLLEELAPFPRQVLEARQYGNAFTSTDGVLNCQGPLLNHAIHRFAAKIGFALHFHITGRCVPKDGGAATWWLTNYHFARGEMPEQLLNMMPGPSTLQQGSWNVGNQFCHSSLRTESGSMTAHFAAFRLSFAVCAFVSEDATSITPPDDVDHVELHLPGWLRGS